MKKIIFSLLLFLMIFALSSKTFACEPKNDEEVIFEIVETQPQFPGGWSALRRFMDKRIFYHYPRMPVSWETLICGRVIVQFVVRKTGEITDINLIRGFHCWADNVAVRIMEEMPNWIPAEHNGEKVNVRFTLPISFRLHCLD
jgi:hypothetical protein